jgi:ABC-2 type transport system ATP-binding protein
MIEVTNLHKEFESKGKKIPAVEGLSFTINQGESVAFIGPNGAGKSTTIKILTGILHPTGGEVFINGISPTKNRKKAVLNIGAVFGQRSNLLPNLPPKDTFMLFGYMYGLKKDEINKRIEELVKEFDLHEIVDRPVRSLSLGQRMKVEVACALIHKPRILFLDEPSIGLDIIAKQALRETLLKLKEEHNVTIFLTSHDVGDIDKVCERTIIINHGKIVLDKKTDELKELSDDLEFVISEFY